MGYASYVYEIVTSSPLKDEDDDQLFYTKVYLDDDLRVSWLKMIHIQLLKFIFCISCFNLY